MYSGNSGAFERTICNLPGYGGRHLSLPPHGSHLEERCARSIYPESVRPGPRYVGRSDAILTEVVDAVRRWREFAAKAGVAPAQIERIANAHRLQFS